MGGDGGVIAAKREFMQSCGDVFGTKGGMVKTALNRAETAELRTKVCAISNERLREPVAACELGYFYNKDTLLAGLLNRDLNPAFDHIRGLKDIVDCRLTPNPAYAALEDRAMDGPEPARFMCPVTLQEMNGLHQFVVLFSTGWVMAEKATKEVGIVGLQEEYGPFTEADIIRLAPTDDEREARKKALISKREKVRLAKKAKKSARRDKASTASAERETSSSPSLSKYGAVSSLTDAGDGKTVSGIPGQCIGKSVRIPGSEASKSTSSRKRRKINKEALARTGAGGGTSEGHIGASTGQGSSGVARAAAEVVKKNKEQSKSYASLFGKKDVSNETLFIATAGHRYNLN